jgi:LacI family transcriptional regulator
MARLSTATSFWVMNFVWVDPQRAVGVHALPVARRLPALRHLLGPGATSPSGPGSRWPPPPRRSTQRDEVAPATRTRVLQAADELSFQPNVLARGLISGNTRTVGLLTDELSAARFAIPVLLGAENALGNEQMSVLLCDARGDAIRRRHYIRTLLARQVDGFIILGDANEIRPSLTRDIPVPVVYAYCESDDPDDLSVVADDAGGARLAAEHLVSLGRKRIAHITGDLTATAPPATAPPRCARSSTRPGCPWSASRCSASGRSAGAGTPRPACSPAPGHRRHLLRQRPDRLRGDRGPARPGPDGPRRRGGGRLRQLGGHRRRVPPAADHRRPQPRNSSGATAVRHLFAALDGDRHSGVRSASRAASSCASPPRIDAHRDGQLSRHP